MEHDQKQDGKNKKSGSVIHQEIRSRSLEANVSNHVRSTWGVTGWLLGIMVTRNLKIKFNGHLWLLKKSGIFFWNAVMHQSTEHWAVSENQAKFVFSLSIFVDGRRQQTSHRLKNSRHLSFLIYLKSGCPTLHKPNGNSFLIGLCEENHVKSSWSVHLCGTAAASVIIWFEKQTEKKTSPSYLLL